MGARTISVGLASAREVEMGLGGGTTLENRCCDQRCRPVGEEGTGRMPPVTQRTTSVLFQDR